MLVLCVCDIYKKKIRQLAVWSSGMISLRVREVPGSIPGTAPGLHLSKSQLPCRLEAATTGSTQVAVTAGDELVRARCQALRKAAQSNSESAKARWGLRGASADHYSLALAALGHGQFRSTTIGGRVNCVRMSGRMLRPHVCGASKLLGTRCFAKWKSIFSFAGVVLCCLLRLLYWSCRPSIKYF